MTRRTRIGRSRTLVRTPAPAPISRLTSPRPAETIRAAGRPRPVSPGRGTVESVVVPEPRIGRRGQGASQGRARLHLERHDRRRLDRARLQPRVEPRPRRRGGRRPAGAGDHDPRLHPDALRRVGLLLPEPRRSRLRHDVLLGHARDGPASRDGWRLGHRRRRRDRDGEPLADRRPVLVLPRRRRQPAPPASGGRCWSASSGSS